MIYNNLIAATKKIKKTNRYTNLAILAFKLQEQTIAAHVPHSCARYFQFRLWLKALIITDEMVILWIIISLKNLQNLLVICLAGAKLDLKSHVVFVFAYKTATINPVL